MLAFMNRARTKRANGEDGFTLIELLVVVVILGILIAIAIPVYLNYRKSANDKAAQSDLRGAVSTLEVCSSDGSYPTAVASTGGMTGCGTSTTAAVTLSTGTTLTYFPDSGTSPTAYIIEAKNAGGSGTDGKVYCYASSAGGSVTGLKTTTTVVAKYAAACPAA